MRKVKERRRAQYAMGVDLNRCGCTVQTQAVALEDYGKGPFDHDQYQNFPRVVQISCSPTAQQSRGLESYRVVESKLCLVRKILLNHRKLL